MKSIRVNSSQGNYILYVGDRLLSKVSVYLEKALKKDRGPRKVMIISQCKILRLYGRGLFKAFRKKKWTVRTHLVPNGEKAKSEKELSKIYHALLKNHFERRDVVLGLGGGVVGDLSGYAASSYLRGVPFANIGTTLLAQVDSSIGGKTGINLREGKNLVGAFYPPKVVFSDIGTLRTLPQREFRASLAEVVKYGMIRNPQLFRDLENRAPSILAKEKSILTKVVTACARIKAQVVSRDEKETRGERMILDYGHTFGHAFEQAVRYRSIMHGEAVSIGMVCAAQLAQKLKLLSGLDVLRQTDLLKRLGLLVSIGKYRLKVQVLCQAMMYDKKRKSGKLRFILPDRIGHVVVRDDIPMHLVRKVLAEVGGRV